MNKIRGLLAEYGLVVPKHIGQLRRRLPIILSDTSNELTPLGRETFVQLYEDILASDTRIHPVDTRLKQICSTSEACQRLVQLEGIGPLIATAMVAAVGDPTVFKTGRQLAAWFEASDTRPPRPICCIKSCRCLRFTQWPTLL